MGEILKNAAVPAFHAIMVRRNFESVRLNMFQSSIGNIGLHVGASMQNLLKCRYPQRKQVALL